MAVSEIHKWATRPSLVLLTSADVPTPIPQLPSLLDRSESEQSENIFSDSSVPGDTPNACSVHVSSYSTFKSSPSLETSKSFQERNAMEKTAETETCTTIEIEVNEDKTGNAEKADKLNSEEKASEELPGMDSNGSFHLTYSEEDEEEKAGEDSRNGTGNEAERGKLQPLFPTSKKWTNNPDWVEVARKMKTLVPSFVRPIRRRHLQEVEWLDIPPRFSRKHLGPPGGTLLLELRDGRSWAVGWASRGPKSFGFSSGWSAFAAESCLRKNDLLLFQLAGERRFQVTRLAQNVGRGEQKRKRKREEGGDAPFEGRNGEQNGGPSHYSSLGERNSCCLEEQPPATCHPLIGRQVSRDNTMGRVTEYKTKLGFYFVEYEDGDCEELSWADIQQCTMEHCYVKLEDVRAPIPRNGSPNGNGEPANLLLGLPLKKKFKDPRTRKCKWFRGTVSSFRQTDVFSVLWENGEVETELEIQDLSSILQPLSSPTMLPATDSVACDGAEQNSPRSSQSLVTDSLPVVGKPKFPQKSDETMANKASENVRAEGELRSREEAKLVREKINLLGRKFFREMCASAGSYGQKYKTGHWISQRRPVTDAERRAALDNGLRFSAGLGKDKFSVKAMSPSHVYCGFWFGGLTRTFTAQNLPPADCQLALQDEEGKVWKTMWKGGRRSGGISGGWKAFAVGHGLEEGDVCVFEALTGNPHASPVLSVTIFRVVEPPHGKASWPIKCPEQH